MQSQLADLLSGGRLKSPELEVESPLESLNYQFALAAGHLNLEKDLQQLLKLPYRELHVQIPVKMDNGRLKIFYGYRFQHNAVRGPYLGGIRLHEDLNREEILALATQMTWKTAIVDVPLGGSMGGIVADPKKLSGRELQALSRGFISKVDLLIGPQRDILSPDLNSDEQIMAWMTDEYGKKHGYSPAIATGKPVGLSGLLGRKAAGGRSVAFCLEEACELYGIKIGKSTAVIQGFGNIGRFAAKFLHELGCRVLAVTGRAGGVFEPGGLDIPALLEHAEESGSVQGFKGQAISNRDLYKIKCDIVIPAAMGGVLTGEVAKALDCKLVAEAASSPTTKEADILLQSREIPVIPDLLCGAGSVVANYLEWAQNFQQFRWDEEQVNRELKKMITRAFRDVSSIAKERSVPLRTAAYMCAIGRVAETTRLRMF